MVENSEEKSTVNADQQYISNSKTSETLIQKQHFVSMDDSVPEEIKGWNWGAFAFNIFWGIGNQTYLPLLCLIPTFNIGWIFVCGAKGNEWAWKSGGYTSVEEFKIIQNSWKRAGLVQAVLMAMGAVFYSLIGLMLIGLVATYGARINHLNSDRYNFDNYYNYDYDYDSSEGSSDYYGSDSSASITDIPNWTQEIYSSITLATELINPETNIATYEDGTSFADLVSLVGEPEDIVREGNTVTATWWSPSYDFIDIEYDIPSGLILDKYKSSNLRGSDNLKSPFSNYQLTPKISVNYTHK